MHLPDVASISALASASVFAEEISVMPLVAEWVALVLLVVFFFVLRPPSLKVVCLCGAEFCLWLTCRHIFVEGFWVRELMTWVTAVAIICVFITVVSHINWGSLRGESKR